MSTQPELRSIVYGRLAEINEIFYAARQTYRRAISLFNQEVRYVKFRKVLGFGGSGIATLWSEVDRQGNPLRDFAVKVPMDEDDPYFRMEISWMSVSVAG
ncbi:hypothetical protein F4677DRAFT_415629 [Hypoxylon crocopeplum]|nr:hypothetical protein F4677DRAFT_415629 [Hypoxylon crocopeplum]